MLILKHLAQRRRKRLRRRYRHEIDMVRNKKTSALDRVTKVKATRIITAGLVALTSALLIDPHLLVVLLPVAACIALLICQKSRRPKKRRDVGDPSMSSSLGPNLDGCQQSRQLNSIETFRRKATGHDG